MKKTINKLVCLISIVTVLLSISHVSHAKGLSSGDFYVSGSLGYSKFINLFKNKDYSSKDYHRENTSVSSAFGFGYDISDILSVEIGYKDFGRAKLMQISRGIEDKKFFSFYRVTGTYLGVRARTEVKRGLGLFGTCGVANWRAKISGGQTYDAHPTKMSFPKKVGYISNGNPAPYCGVGIERTSSGSLSAHAQITYYGLLGDDGLLDAQSFNLNGKETDYGHLGLSVGLRYHF